MADAFEILGLPRSFDVTSSQVAAAHLRACATLHPDRAKDALERDDFMRRAAAAGEAKQRLMSDVGRAEALLAARGVDAKLEVPLPPAFLMETMELRERIEESLTDPAARVEMHDEVATMREACVRELALACRDAGSDTHAARAALARLRYIDRMQARLQDGADPT